MMELQKRLQEKMEELTKQDVCVAFSGGVDSSLLLKMATMAAAKNHTMVYATTISTRLQPWEDTTIARKVAQECGAEHHLLVIDESRKKEILQNGKDRCYWCKSFLFQSLKDWAGVRNVTTIIEGSNADDLLVYRPGLKAVKELGAVSPLAELGIMKEQVRQMAQNLGISVAKRPSAPCMATRLPYNTPLDFDAMERLEKGERQMRQLGFEVVRLRLHGEILRIEVEEKMFPRLLDMRKGIVSMLQELGFHYITLDIEGFLSGSMDRW